ncbi:MAG: hypothetical protein AB3N10_04135, partial [Allomuricauda sp.]
ESARVLAEKLSKLELSEEEKITQAFRRVVCRMPKNEERELLVDYLKEQKEHFTKNPALAEEFINVGEYPAQKNRDAIYVASLMQVIHTMYNLEETMTRS